MGSTSKKGAGDDKGPLAPAYLLLGDDLPKVEKALRRLRARIVEESGTELNIDEFVAGQHSARDVVGAANTLAFLSGIRLVLVHGVEQWRKADKDEIAAYLRSPAPDSCLTLVGGKLPPTDPLRKAVAAVGGVLEYAAPKSGALPAWVAKEARRFKTEIEPAAARALVQRVGEDQHVLLREVEKLATYRGRSHIRVEDVELLSARTVEASIFDLVDSVATRRAAGAFAAVEDLYHVGESPTGLLFRVIRHYQHLSRAVALREAGMAPADIQGALKMKPFPAKKVVQQAVAYDSAAIGRALGVLAETDARMKGMGDLSPELELEICLGRLLEG